MNFHSRHHCIVQDRIRDIFTFFERRFARHHLIFLGANAFAVLVRLSAFQMRKVSFFIAHPEHCFSVELFAMGRVTVRVACCGILCQYHRLSMIDNGQLREPKCIRRFRCNEPAAEPAGLRAAGGDGLELLPREGRTAWSGEPCSTHCCMVLRPATPGGAGRPFRRRPGPISTIRTNVLSKNVFRNLQKHLFQ